MRLVRRHDGAFGRTRLSEVLAGKRTSGVVEHGLHRDPAFGAIDDALALKALDDLIAGGWLQVSGQERNRPVLRLADKAAGVAAVMADNPPQPPPERLDRIQMAQVRRLMRWRDVIATREEKPAAKVATLRKLKALVRLSPASVDELAVSGLLGEDVPVRFWRTVIDVVQGKLGDPTLAELIQTLTLAPGASASGVMVTADVLEWGRSPRGGFTKAQLEHIDVAWPPAARWRDDVVGRALPVEKLRGFLAPALVVVDHGSILNETGIAR